MKKLIFTLLIVSSMYAEAQNHVYDSNHNKLDFTSEELELELTDEPFTLKSQNLAPLLIAAIPTVVDLGFKLTTKYLEKNVKKFSSEYSRHNTFLEAATGNVPKVTFFRNVTIENTQQKAIEIKFKTEKVPSLERAFYYYVSDINLKNTSAKTTSKFPTVDYTIELKIDYTDNKERKTVELAPVTISSVKYGANTYTKDKYRTDFISIPDGAIIIGASIKIVETNPGKVRAEKILSVWNDNKDDAKTIINNFLPKEEKKEEGKKQDKPAEDANAETGSVSNKSKGK